MSGESEQEIGVRVGHFDPSGEFLGMFTRFSGKVVGSRTEHPVDEATGQEDPERGTTYTLYACPTGYRVHVFDWSERQDEGSEARLMPNLGPKGYSEEEARGKFPRLFDALAGT